MKMQIEVYDVHCIPIYNSMSNVGILIFIPVVHAKSDKIPN